MLPEMNADFEVSEVNCVIDLNLSMAWLKEFERSPMKIESIPSLLEITCID